MIGFYKYYYLSCLIFIIVANFNLFIKYFLKKINFNYFMKCFIINFNCYYCLECFKINCYYSVIGYFIKQIINSTTKINFIMH